MKSKIFVISAATLLVGATASHANIIFTDSFESPVNTRNWQVYDTFGPWTSTGTGIEIQTSGTVSGVSAHDGNQYVELDSDRSRGGDSTATTTNSSMTRVINEQLLGPGLYRLAWYYLPRTNNNGDDNLIEVYVDGFGEFLEADNKIGQVSAKRSGVSDWQLVTFDFRLDGTENDYAVTFIAGGQANTLGGFIDSVSLAAVPLPASVLLLGSALGAAGIAGWRRRRSA